MVLFSYGFRPFFALSLLWSIVALGLWTHFYSFGGQIPGNATDQIMWHAHEMIFGFGYAVIAGFLLTAVSNWTSIKTVEGTPLALICLAWTLARVSFLSNNILISTLGGIFECYFMLAVFFFIIKPIIKKRQKRHTGILLAYCAGIISCMLYIYGDLMQFRFIQEKGLYGGLYSVIVLILLIARRILPFFTERAQGGSQKVMTPAWTDRINGFVLALFWFFATFFAHFSIVLSFIYALLCIIHSARLICWFRKTALLKPLLWILFIGYFFLILGFACGFTQPFLHLPKTMVIHIFSIGSVGVLCAGMIARVSLGHTGRNVYQPPKLITIPFMLLIGSCIARTLFVQLLPGLTQQWIALAQFLWLGSFVWLSFMYIPILLSPRVDGKPG